jgi:hypothetical protein
MGKKSGSGSGKNNPDHTVFPRAQKPFFGVKILKLFDADPGSGMEKIRIRDPGWKTGSGIREKHSGSATLLSCLYALCPCVIFPVCLQVAELRDALEARGLDTKGTKPFLVERLTEALAAEAANGGGEAVEAVEAVEGSESPAQEEQEQQEDDVPMEEESPPEAEAAPTIEEVK